MLRSNRNVAPIQTGCAESQTPYLSRSSKVVAMGSWIPEFAVDEEKLRSRFKGGCVSWPAEGKS
jgi:hypothetical protein